MIGDEIEVCIVEIRGDKVRLGITAPPEVPVDRAEVRRSKRDEAERQRAAAASENGERGRPFGIALEDSYPAPDGDGELVRVRIAE